MNNSQVYVTRTCTIPVLNESDVHYRHCDMIQTMNGYRPIRKDPSKIDCIYKKGAVTGQQQ